MNKKIFCMILSICILLSLGGCTQSNEQYEMIPLTNVDEYFKIVHNIEPTEQYIPLELAKENYVSHAVDIDNEYSIEMLAECFKYKHTSISNSDNLECFIFDIEGFESLKYYMYINKNVATESMNYVPYLVQTVFVDEKYKNKNIEFFISDTIADLKEKYPQGQVVKRPRLLGAEIFEILNDDVLYIYYVDFDGNIVNKELVSMSLLLRYYF